MERFCEFCKVNRALVYCIADAANLCLTCDAKVHSANSLSGRHLRTFLCDSCKNQPCFVRCLDHKMLLCNGCDEKLHGGVTNGHRRRGVRCYNGCPLAKDFAVMWGFRVVGDDVSLEQALKMVQPKVQREAGLILEQICELEKLQLREQNSDLFLKEQADPSPLPLPRQSEEHLFDLQQTGKELIVDFSHLSSSSISDSFWECKSPFYKNNQLWYQNLQDIGVCEDTVCDDNDDDFHIPDIDITFQNYEELFGADQDPIPDNNNILFVNTFDTPLTNSIVDPKQGSSSLSFSRSNGDGSTEMHYPHNPSEKVISFCSSISKLKEKKKRA